MELPKLDRAAEFDSFNGCWWILPIVKGPYPFVIKVDETDEDTARAVAERLVQIWNTP